MITSSIMGDRKLSVNWPEMIDLSMNLSEDPSLFRSPDYGFGSGVQKIPFLEFLRKKIK